MQNDKQRPVRSGQLGHSINFPSSLELAFDFWKSSFFDQNLDWTLMDCHFESASSLILKKGPSGGASPLRTTVCRLPGRDFFVF